VAGGAGAGIEAVAGVMGGAGGVWGLPVGSSDVDRQEV
jgi:hypothetical protein